MANKKIIELDAASQVNSDALFPLSQLVDSNQKTLKATVAQMQAAMLAPVSGLVTLGESSGSIASFSTDIADKLFSCYVNVTAVQAGSGTPAPDNVRAISGWSECNLSATGKNLFDKSTATLEKFINYTGGQAVEQSNTSKAHSTIIKVKPSTTYYMSGYADTSYYSILALDENLNPIEWYGGASKTAAFTATLPNNCRFVYLNFNKDQINTVIFAESVSSVAYESFGTTYTIPFNQTVYGGVLDVLSGVLTVTHDYIASYNGETINTPWICSQAEYAEGVTPPTGSQVVYPLTTPTTIQLTPTEVKTILGQNNIFADFGDIDLKYLETIGNRLS